MSLRGFHYIFITLSVILSLGFAYLEFAAYSQGKMLADAVVAVVAAIIGVGLACYGVWFYKKSQRAA